MKKILILLLLATQCLAQEPSKHVDLDNISTKGFDKNVAKVFKQTKKLILKSRKEKDRQTEMLGTEQWCYLLHNFKFLEQAKDCYFLVGMETKSEANWPYLYGKAALQQGNVADAIIGFEQALKKEVNYLPAHYYLIQIAIEQGDLLKAFEFHSRVPANLRLTANMLNVSGDMFTQVENYYVANGYYQQAITLVPKADSLNYKIAQNYQLLEKSELAIKYLSKSGHVGIALPDPYYQQVKDTTVGEIPYLIKGKTALSNLDFKQAIKLYKKALDFNPESNSAQINIAVAYFQNKQVSKALEIFEKLYKETPNNLKVLYNLAIIAIFQNETSKAINYFETFRNINNQDKGVNNELAKLYYQIKEYDKVIEIGNEAVMAVDEKMQLLKAKSLVHTKQFFQALELLTEINKYKPNNNEVLLLLAKLYSQVPDSKLRNAELSVKYAQNAFENEASQLSYWQLIIALDEAEKCTEMEKIVGDFAQLVKVEKQQVKSQLALQRGEELRCKID